MGLVSKDSSWWVFTLPAFFGSKNLLDGYVLFSLFMAFLSISLLSWAFAVGGIAWKNGRNQKGRLPIHGPKGLPIFGSLFTLSHGLAHRTLAAMAWTRANTQLMAFSLGSTPVVVASDPHTAQEILTSPPLTSLTDLSYNRLKVSCSVEQWGSLPVEPIGGF